MSDAPNILAFAGSARKASWNKLLLKTAADAAGKAGASVTVVDLRDYPMPLMDEDYESEHGMPESAARFKALMIAHDGFLISAPEYNSSITPLLKNAIDWASRKTGDEAPLAAFTGKTAALVSASPGALGGLRGLVHLRAILSNINVLVIPDQFALSKAHEAFDAQGHLIDAKQRAIVEGIATRLVAVTSRLKG